MVAAITAPATGVATGVAIMVAAMVAAITAPATGVATAVRIRILTLHIPINPLEQTAGKIEVMGILLKTLNMKVVGVEEKGEFRMTAMLQLRKISTPFLLASLSL